MTDKVRHWATPAFFHRLEGLGVERALCWDHPPSGLRAIAIIDNTTLGPSVGGIRTRVYASPDDALDDALELARAMTTKCALAGLAAGGCKMVIMDGPHLKREAAFAELGKRIEALGGQIRTAGDLGTTVADLEHAAAHCQWVHLAEASMTDAVARGLVGCIEVCTALRDRNLDDVTIAVQGCGAIGAAVARRLAARGARLLLSDIDAARADRLAHETNAIVIAPNDVLDAPVDIFCPCAIGGVINETVATKLRAWAVVGAANNVLHDERAAEILRDRNVLFVPDVIASAGAAIEGVGLTIMHLPDRTPLINALADTARTVLQRAASTGQTTTTIAQAIANERLAAAQ
jgi:leucine dehydrogenase